MNQVIYSTDSNLQCANCGKQPGRCRCKKSSARKTADASGKVFVQRETKGRKGKGVTIVKGIPLAEDEIKALAKKLKKVCGSGGTIKNGILEIQGDHCDQVINYLSQYPWTVKRAGG